MFNGYKEPASCYTNQQYFDSSNQSVYQDNETDKQTASSGQWDYPTQHYGPIPCYGSVKHLDYRQIPSTNNIPTTVQNDRKEKQNPAKMSENTISDHYSSTNNIVRPTALINCQANCNTCFSHTHKVSQHCNASSESTKYLDDPTVSRDNACFTESNNTYSVNNSQFIDDFASSLNKLSKFPKDGVTYGETNVTKTPKSDLSPTSSSKHQSGEGNARESSVSCEDSVHNSRLYKPQPVSFPSHDSSYAASQHSVKREDMLRYSGDAPQNPSCAQWRGPGRQQGDMWFQNPPNFWMPHNTPVTSYWYDRSGGIRNVAQPIMPSNYDVLKYKSDVLQGNGEKLHKVDKNSEFRYPDIPSRKNEILRSKETYRESGYQALQEKNMLRYHEMSKNPTHLQKNNDKSRDYGSKNKRMISHPHNIGSNMAAYETTTPGFVSHSVDPYCNNNIQGANTFPPHYRPKISEAFTTGIAPPPARFDPDLAFAQSRISRSSNYLQCFDTPYVPNMPLPQSNDVNCNAGSSMRKPDSSGPFSHFHPQNGQYIDGTVKSHAIPNMKHHSAEMRGEITSHFQPCNRTGNDSEYGKNMQVVDAPAFSMQEKMPVPNSNYLYPKPPHASHGNVGIPPFYPPFHPVTNENRDYNLFTNGNLHSSYDINMLPHNNASNMFTYGKGVCNMPPYHPTRNEGQSIIHPQMQPEIESPSSVRQAAQHKIPGDENEDAPRTSRKSNGPVLDVRQYLANWDEESEDVTVGPPRESDSVLVLDFQSVNSEVAEEPTNLSLVRHTTCDMPDIDIDEENINSGDHITPATSNENTVSTSTAVNIPSEPKNCNESNENEANKLLKITEDSSMPDLSTGQCSPLVSSPVLPLSAPHTNSESSTKVASRNSEKVLSNQTNLLTSESADSVKSSIYDTQVHSNESRKSSISSPLSNIPSKESFIEQSPTEPVPLSLVLNKHSSGNSRSLASARSREPNSILETFTMGKSVRTPDFQDEVELSDQALSSVEDTLSLMANENSNNIYGVEEGTSTPTIHSPDNTDNKNNVDICDTPTDITDIIRTDSDNCQEIINSDFDMKDIESFEKNVLDKLDTDLKPSAVTKSVDHATEITNTTGSAIVPEATSDANILTNVAESDKSHDDSIGNLKASIATSKILDIKNEKSCSSKVSETSVALCIRSNNLEENKTCAVGSATKSFTNNLLVTYEENHPMEKDPDNLTNITSRFNQTRPSCIEYGSNSSVSSEHLNSKSSDEKSLATDTRKSEHISCVMATENPCNDIELLTVAAPPAAKCSRSCTVIHSPISMSKEEKPKVESSELEKSQEQDANLITSNFDIQNVDQKEYKPFHDDPVLKCQSDKATETKQASVNKDVLESKHCTEQFTIKEHGSFSEASKTEDITCEISTDAKPSTVNVLELVENLHAEFTEAVENIECSVDDNNVSSDSTVNDSDVPVQKVQNNKINEPTLAVFTNNVNNTNNKNDDFRKVDISRNLMSEVDIKHNYVNNSKNIEDVDKSGDSLQDRNQFCSTETTLNQTFYNINNTILDKVSKSPIQDNNFQIIHERNLNDACKTSTSATAEIHSENQVAGSTVEDEQENTKNVSSNNFVSSSKNTEMKLNNSVSCSRVKVMLDGCNDNTKTKLDNENGSIDYVENDTNIHRMTLVKGNVEDKSLCQDVENIENNNLVDEYKSPDVQIRDRNFENGGNTKISCCDEEREICSNIKDEIVPVTICSDIELSETVENNKHIQDDADVSNSITSADSCSDLNRTHAMDCNTAKSNGCTSIAQEIAVVTEDEEKPGIDLTCKNHDFLSKKKNSTSTNTSVAQEIPVVSEDEEKPDIDLDKVDISRNHNFQSEENSISTNTSVAQEIPVVSEDEEKPVIDLDKVDISRDHTEGISTNTNTSVAHEIHVISENEEKPDIDLDKVDISRNHNFQSEENSTSTNTSLAQEIPVISEDEEKLVIDLDKVDISRNHNFQSEENSTSTNTSVAQEIPVISEDEEKPDIHLDNVDISKNYDFQLKENSTSANTSENVEAVNNYCDLHHIVIVENTAHKNVDFVTSVCSKLSAQNANGPDCSHTCYDIAPNDDIAQKVEANMSNIDSIKSSDVTPDIEETVIANTIDNNKNIEFENVDKVSGESIIQNTDSLKCSNTNISLNAESMIAERIEQNDSCLKKTNTDTSQNNKELNEESIIENDDSCKSKDTSDENKFKNDSGKYNNTNYGTSTKIDDSFKSSDIRNIGITQIFHDSYESNDTRNENVIQSDNLVNNNTNTVQDNMDKNITVNIKSPNCEYMKTNLISRDNAVTQSVDTVSSSDHVEYNDERNIKEPVSNNCIDTLNKISVVSNTDEKQDRLHDHADLRVCHNATVGNMDTTIRKHTYIATDDDNSGEFLKNSCEITDITAQVCDTSSNRNDGEVEKYELASENHETEVRENFQIKTLSEVISPVSSNQNIGPKEQQQLLVGTDFEKEPETIAETIPEFSKKSVSTEEMQTEKNCVKPRIIFKDTDFVDETNYEIVDMDCDSESEIIHENETEIQNSNRNRNNSFLEHNDDNSVKVPLNLSECDDVNSVSCHVPSTIPDECNTKNNICETYANEFTVERSIGEEQVLLQREVISENRNILTNADEKEMVSDKVNENQSDIVECSFEYSDTSPIYSPKTEVESNCVAVCNPSDACLHIDRVYKTGVNGKSNVEAESTNNVCLEKNTREVSEEPKENEMLLSPTTPNSNNLSSDTLKSHANEEKFDENSRDICKISNVDNMPPESAAVDDKCGKLVSDRDKNVFSDESESSNDSGFKGFDTNEQSIFENDYDTKSITFGSLNFLYSTASRHGSQSGSLSSQSDVNVLTEVCIFNAHNLQNTSTKKEDTATDVSGCKDSPSECKGNNGQEDEISILKPAEEDVEMLEDKSDISDGGKSRTKNVEAEVNCTLLKTAESILSQSEEEHDNVNRELNLKSRSEEVHSSTPVSPFNDNASRSKMSISEHGIDAVKVSVGGSIIASKKEGKAHNPSVVITDKFQNEVIDSDVSASCDDGEKTDDKSIERVSSAEVKENVNVSGVENLNETTLPICPVSNTDTISVHDVNSGSMQLNVSGSDNDTSQLEKQDEVLSEQVSNELTGLYISSSAPCLSSSVLQITSCITEDQSKTSIELSIRKVTEDSENSEGETWPVVVQSDSDAEIVIAITDDDSEELFVESETPYLNTNENSCVQHSESPEMPCLEVVTNVHHPLDSDSEMPILDAHTDHDGRETSNIAPSGTTSENVTDNYNKAHIYSSDNLSPVLDSPIIDSTISCREKCDSDADVWPESYVDNDVIPSVDQSAELHIDPVSNWPYLEEEVHSENYPVSDSGSTPPLIDMCSSPFLIGDFEDYPKLSPLPKTPSPHRDFDVIQPLKSVRRTAKKRRGRPRKSVQLARPCCEDITSNDSLIESGYHPSWNKILSVAHIGDHGIKKGHKSKNRGKPRRWSYNKKVDSLYHMANNDSSNLSSEFIENVNMISSSTSEPAVHLHTEQKTNCDMQSNNIVRNIHNTNPASFIMEEAEPVSDSDTLQKVLRSEAPCLVEKIEVETQENVDCISNFEVGCESALGIFTEKSNIGLRQLKCSETCIIPPNESHQNNTEIISELDPDNISEVLDTNTSLKLEQNCLSSEFSVKPKHMLESIEGNEFCSTSVMKENVKSQVPRVIIKRTSAGSEKYESFLCVPHKNKAWQPSVRLYRSKVLDDLARNFLEYNNIRKNIQLSSLRIVVRRRSSLEREREEEQRQLEENMRRLEKDDSCKEELEEKPQIQVENEPSKCNIISTKIPVTNSKESEKEKCNYTIENSTKDTKLILHRQKSIPQLENKTDIVNKELTKTGLNVKTKHFSKKIHDVVDRITEKLNAKNLNKIEASDDSKDKDKDRCKPEEVDSRKPEKMDLKKSERKDRSKLDDKDHKLKQQKIFPKEAKEIKLKPKSKSFDMSNKQIQECLSDRIHVSGKRHSVDHISDKHKSKKSKNEKRKNYFCEVLPGTSCSESKPNIVNLELPTRNISDSKAKTDKVHVAEVCSLDRSKRPVEGEDSGLHEHAKKKCRSEKVEVKSSNSDGREQNFSLPVSKNYSKDKHKSSSGSSNRSNEYRTSHKEISKTVDPKETKRSVTGSDKHIKSSSRKHHDYKTTRARTSSNSSKGCHACGYTYGSRDERLAHIREHLYHCSKCQLAYRTEAELVKHLSSRHSQTKEQHHCLLCERSFPTAARHQLHLEGRQHKQLENCQRRTIHTLFKAFTGHFSPALPPLTPEEDQSQSWFPNEAGITHFYYQATPLQLALQDLTWRQRESVSTSDSQQNT